MNFVGKFDSNLSGAHSSGPIDVGPHHCSTDTITIPDANLLFTGDFKRSGPDLVLSKDGHDLVVQDYFRGATRAALASPDGAQLSASIVDALTGHVQYAQADGSITAAKVIGHVTRIAGSATAIRNGVAVELHMGDNVNKGDVVQAGAASSLGLTFIDGTVFGLSSNARMVLNEMTYDPNGSSNSSLLSLVQGTITFVAGQTAKHGDMRVDTPVATMGIRGTAVLVEIDFQVPGQGGAPPANFQVLVEPDGTTGSYNLYSKTDPNLVLGTVNQAGQVTSVNGSGSTSLSPAPPLSLAAQTLIGQTFELYFPNYVAPRSTGPNGSTPANPVPGNPNPDPLKLQEDLLPFGQPTTVPIKFKLPGDTTDTPATLIPVTIAVLKTIDVTPVVNKASFSIADQVTINDSNPADPIVKYVPGTAKILSVTVVGPGNVPAGTDLTKLLTVDPQTGVVTYPTANFAFLGENQKAIVTIGFDSIAGSETFHETLTETINGVNDPPVITAATVKVAEGGTVLFTPANLGITDPDSTTFVFTVSNVTHGKFQTTTDGINWTDATTFTSADLAAGHVRLASDGGEVAPTFSIQADDGASANHLSNVFTGSVDFTHVNNPPVITSATLSVTEGGTTVLKPSDFGITDPDSDSFTFTVSNVTHGKFQIAGGEQWIDTTTFTSADLAAGRVHFVDDGSAHPPTVTLTVSDGLASSAPVNVAINFAAGEYELTSTAGVTVDVTPNGATSGFVFPGAGNVTTPGIPEDRIALGYNFGDSHVVLNSDPMLGVHEFTPVSSVLTHNDDGSSSVSVTLDAGDNVTLNQTITLGSDANFFTTTIDVFNHGTSDLTDVRFLRNLDPDQDVQAHHDYNTSNDVVQNPNGSESFAIVSATGLESGVQVALVGLGGAWRGSVFGFTNTNPYAGGAFDNPVDPNGAHADQSLSLTYEFGTILAGQHIEVTYFTTANVATSGSNALFGSAGNDTIDGLGGNDLLLGLGGADTFVLKTGYGHDTVYDFTPGTDKIELDFASTFNPGNAGSFNAWLATHTRQAGNDVLIDADASHPGQTTILLKNVSVDSLQASDFIVHNADTAPVAASDASSITAGAAAISGNLLSNDTDADHDTLSVANVTGGVFSSDTIMVEGTYGELVLSKSTGVYTYTLGTDLDQYDPIHAAQAAAVKALAADTTGTDTFGYSAYDGQLGSNAATLTVCITGVNDAPVLQYSADPDPIQMPVDDGYTISSNLTFTDADLFDSHIITVAFDAGLSDPLSTPIGVFNAVRTTDSTDGHNGVVNWSLTLGSNDLVPPGSQVHEVFDVTVDDGHGGTAVQHVSIEIDGPDDSIQTAAPPPPPHVIAIDTNDLHIDQTGYKTTICGLTVTVTNSTDEKFTLTALADHGALETGDGHALPTAPESLTDINAMLAKGLSDKLAGNPHSDDGPPHNDKVTVAVTDSLGATDTVNLIFHAQGEESNITLQGTSGKDVIFATGHHATLTGGGGADQFVFAPHFGSDAVQDTITDFVAGQDKLDIHQFATAPTADTFGSWLHSSAVQQQGNDTLITLDSTDTIFLSNVAKANLSANDFILHPGGTQ